MADTLPSFVLRGHAAEVTSVAFHAHSGAMISSATDGQLRVWDLPTRRCTGTAVAHGRGVGVLSAQFWRDRIVTQGRDGLVKTWDAERLFALPASAELDVFPASSSSSPLSAILNAAPASELPPPPLSVLKTDSYSFCPLGITEQTAASSNPLDPDSSSSDCKNANSSAPVSASKPNSSLLGQALRQEAANRPPPSSALSTPLVGAAHASAASDLIACPGENPSEVLIWDYRSGKTLHRLHASLDSTAPVNTGMCMCLKMADSASTGTPLVACGFESGHLTLHDLRRPDYALSCSALHKEPLLSFDTLGDFSRGLSGSADATLCCFAVDAAPAHVRVERALDLPVAGVSCVRLRPDGALYATAGWDHRVRLFGAKVGRALAALKFHSASVSVVAFPPATLQEYAQEGTLVSASKDGKIAIWQGLYPSKK